MNFDSTTEEDEVPLKDVLRNVIDSVALDKVSQPNILSTVAKRLPTEKKLSDKNKFSVLFSGLPFMLDKKYFDDAFILHDESGGTKQLHDIMFQMMVFEEEFYDKENVEQLNSLEEETVTIRSEKAIADSSAIDMREELDEKWASLKRIFTFQVKTSKKILIQ